MQQAAKSPIDSRTLAGVIRAQDFSSQRVTVVGAGTMGRQYVKALQSLGVRAITLCSRSEEGLRGFCDVNGVTTVPGGYQRLDRSEDPDELAVVATPIQTLGAASAHLGRAGFRRLLVEKPVALSSTEIFALADHMDRSGVDVRVAYNRVAYPSVQELRARAALEGGVTSCAYGFTEAVAAEWEQQYPREVLQRWGIANSLHVMSLAHAVIGRPATWRSYRRGGLSWHPTGSVFVGAGETEHHIPFSYHADWNSKGRWTAEVFTRTAAYRLCPLEKLERRGQPRGEWEPIAVDAFDPTAKAGFVEQVAAALRPETLSVRLTTLREAGHLTAYAEDVFGYR